MAEQLDSVGPVGASGSSDFNTSRESPRVNPPAAPAPAPAPGARPPGAAQPPSAQTLQNAVAQINARLASVNRVLQLSVDPATGITIATIKNAQTGAVLQQIPSDDIMHLAEMLSGWAHGKNVLLDLMA
ncbi:MAG TPA: flagellar protein FlaG [Steroidobacteraceae bacterium]|nr:flagellar protein FlaG [Steroidobacteraceae bacterium]